MTRARNLSRLANTNVLSVDSSNNVGIASTIPDAKLDVIGIVSATSFSGALTGDVTGNASGTAGGLSGSPNITINNLVGVAATFAGSVKIGGTAAVNEMDEYEEGTWTPTQGAGITLVGTFSSGGNYIKIGNLVHVTGWVQGSTSIAISTSPVAVITGGLPFNIKAGGDEMRYDFIVGGGYGVTGAGYAWNTSFYTYSMTISISATSQKILFQLTYSAI